MPSEMGGYQCDVCPGSASSALSLRHHLRSHESRECTRCGRRFAAGLGLDLHKQLGRCPVPLVARTAVVKATTGPPAWAKGLAEPTGDALKAPPAAFGSQGDPPMRCGKPGRGLGDFPCGDCDKAYSRREALLDHRRRSKSCGREKTSCVRCAETFARQAHLNKHLERRGCLSNVQRAQLPFPCPNCDSRFDSLGNLKQHQRRSICSGALPFVCSCGGQFTRKHAYLQHLRSEASKSAKRQYIPTTRRVKKRPSPATCDECGTICTGQANLRRHQLRERCEKALRRRLTPLTCPDCGYGATDGARMRRHRRTGAGCRLRLALRDPTSERSLKVALASKPEGRTEKTNGAVPKAKSERKLQSGLKTPRMKKRPLPVTCANCETVCTGRKSLKRHLNRRRCDRVIQAKSLSLTCQDCGFTAANAAKLLRHRRTGAGCRLQLAVLSAHSQPDHLPPRKQLERVAVTRPEKPLQGDRMEVQLVRLEPAELPARPSPYRCGDCGYSSGKPSGLASHRRSSGLACRRRLLALGRLPREPDAAVCDACGARLRDRGKLPKHQRHHCGKSLRSE